MLAVVEDEQDLAGAQVLDDELDVRLGLPFTDAEHVGDGLDDQGGVADRRELDQPHAVAVRADLRRGGLDREPGLARPAGTGQGQGSGAVQEPFDLPDLAFATDEAAQLDGQVVRPRRGAPAVVPLARWWRRVRGGLVGRRDGSRRGRGRCAEPAFQDVTVEQAARVGRLHIQLPSEDRPQSLELAEGQLATIVQRVHPHQGAVGRFVGRLELEQLAERVGRGVVPAGTLLELRDPREHGQVVLGEVLAEPDGPVGISVIGQWLAHVHRPGGKKVGEAVVRLTDRSVEGRRVDPHLAGRGKADRPVAEHQRLAAPVTDGAEGGAGHTDRLVEVVRGRLERTVRPELLHQRLAMEPVAGREGQDPNQLGRLSQAPCRTGHGPIVDLDVEAAQHAHPHCGRDGTRRAHGFRLCHDPSMRSVLRGPPGGFLAPRAVAGKSRGRLPKEPASKLSR